MARISAEHHCIAGKVQHNNNSVHFKSEQLQVKLWSDHDHEPYEAGSFIPWAFESVENLPYLAMLDPRIGLSWSRLWFCTLITIGISSSPTIYETAADHLAQNHWMQQEVQLMSLVSKPHPFPFTWSLPMRLTLSSPEVIQKILGSVLFQKSPSLR